MATVAEIEQMISTGASAQDVLDAVRADLQFVTLHRQKAADRQRNWRGRNVTKNGHNVTDNVTRNVTNVTQDLVVKQQENPADSSNVTAPADVRSIYTSSSESKKERKKKFVGSRLPDDWQPLPTDLDFARTVLSDDRTSVEVAKFRDYWHAKTGAGATKRDWSATWRNWCRTAAERGGNTPRAGPPTLPLNQPKRPVGWRPGLPTPEEMEARYGRNQEPDREGVLPEGGGVHRKAAGG